MSKIIINNTTGYLDHIVFERVLSVVRDGFISGENQYCFHTQFGMGDGGAIHVEASKTKSGTHSFKVYEEG